MKPIYHQDITQNKPVIYVAGYFYNLSKIRDSLLFIIASDDLQPNEVQNKVALVVNMLSCRHKQHQFPTSNKYTWNLFKKKKKL